ncbi:MAG: hypothetical protein H0U45_17540 [Tatlockia sp.]|nr:hypothetical protein [Tatlockia sp.]
MNNINQFISRFFKYTFLGKIENSERIVDINSGEIELKPSPKFQSFSQDQVRLQLITRINWFLLIVCGVSFTVIVLYALAYPSKPVPDIIQNAFFTTLGWFGGALGTFFQIDQNRS